MSTSPTAYAPDDAIKTTMPPSGAASMGIAEAEAQARPGQNPYAVVGARTAPKSLGAGVSDPSPATESLRPLPFPGRTGGRGDAVGPASAC